MPRAIRKSYRFSPEMIARLDELRALWGGIAPITETAALDEAVRRALDAERKAGGKSPKKSPKVS